MTEEEANQLYSFIILERSPEQVEVRQIANGEHVVILLWCQWWLWSFDDWTAFRQRDELARRKPVESRLVLV